MDKTLTGKNITVAIFDTGIYAEHIVFTADGTQDWDDKILAFYDGRVNGEVSDPYDVSWHGTWTASILGGDSVDYQGVAPGVNFVIVKVFDYEENKLTSTIPMIQNAVDWIIENVDKYDIKIVSMSFGAEPEGDLGEILELEDTVERLADEGILVVAAAGNEGNDPSSITAPASAKSVLAVGGVDYDGNMYLKSGAGPSLEGTIKPDVCAPAISVKGASASASVDEYSTHSGTSAATPFVSGLSALMLEKDPKLTWSELKAIISLTSFRTIEPRTIKDNQQGWGVIQGYAALDALDESLEFTSNTEIDLTLNMDYSVFCQPISINSGQFFLELNQLDSIEAEMYLFDKIPDEFGNPILLSHTISNLEAFDKTQRLGISPTASNEYYLVVKLLNRNGGEGDFSINVIIDYRVGIVIILTIANSIAMVYIGNKLYKFKKNKTIKK